MSRLARRVGIALGALLALLLIVFLGATLWLRSSLPDNDRELTVDALDGDVHIYWDALGIPSIVAQNEHDLLFAQGWVHAQDRLWQMELFRRVAEARLAEVLGEELLDSDGFLRTVGIWRTVTEAEARMAPETRARLQAYVDGVNAYLAERDGALPPEFVLLGLEPEPWTVRHTLAIERLMAWDLAAYSMEIEAARAAARFGPERARWLVPDYPQWGATIVHANPAAGAALTAAIPEPARALLESMNVRLASNAWVIGGARTASGKPILANDMHLALRAPGVWYLVGLHGGGYDVAGMSLPGAPFVVAGHNRAVAWGFTNAMTDDADLFVERIDPTDSMRYLTPQGFEPFVVIDEQIRVKGRDEPVAHRVRRTRHGPVISDVTDGLGAEPVALRWAAHDSTNAVAALPYMNAASSAAQFREALRLFDNPHQNVVFADTAGDFGYQMAGHVPLRGDRRMPPALPVPGWTGEWDWSGRLPFEEHPAADAAVASGYVATANNRQSFAGAGDLVTALWEQPHRAARIEQMIEHARAPLTTRDVHRMQLDVGDVHALRYRDRAIEAARAAGHDSIASALASWDARATLDSRIAGVWYAWYHRMRALAGRDFWGEDNALSRAALDNVLELRALPWRADGAAEFARLARQAIDEAIASAAGLTWGEMHRGKITHPMDAVPLLDRLMGISMGPFPLAGSSTTVNVSQWLDTDFPVTTQYGPSERHVVDMGDVDGAGGFILPAGQSGIPFSRHYRDQNRAWREGGLWRIPVDPALLEARAVAVTQLRAN